MKACLTYKGSYEQRLRAALADFKEYLGQDNYNMLLDSAIDTPNLSFDQLRGSLAILGVEGLPVRAFWLEIIRLRIN